MDKRFCVLIVVLFASILFASCDNTSSSFNNAKSIDAECMAPHNPYNNGGGHDAGFNWAAENGDDCNSNSDSFNEGCAEYFRQLNKYNECLAKKNK
jgi:hypothetical protein